MSIDSENLAPIIQEEMEQDGELTTEAVESLAAAQKVLDVPEVITVEPVKPAERVGAVDILRGVALLGILAMNINNFGWPGSVYSNPIADRQASDLDVGLWAFNHVVLDTKMMTIFSMLFGAGLVLMSDRADGRKANLCGIYYRRILWLAVIGLVHAYFLWDGDILVVYAQCGLLLYPFRHRSPKTLLIVGTILSMLMVPLLFGFQSAVRYAQRTTVAVAAQIKAGETPHGFRNFVHRKWTSSRAQSGERGDGFEKDLKTYRGGYWDIFKDRANDLWRSHTFGFIFGFWYICGRMLIGMGLMKLGVFSASRSKQFYQRMMIFGYGFGLPLVVADTIQLYLKDWYVTRPLESLFNGSLFLGTLSGIPLALGHIGLVMWIIQSGSLQWLTTRLGAAGRMALSNYLFDSILCTTLFYGYAFGLYGKMHRTELYLLVIAIWTFQLWFSPIWLGKFRYGPAEWLWRSLTYWQLQPMRRRVEPALIAV